MSRILRWTHDLHPWCNSYDYMATKESMWPNLITEPFKSRGFYLAGGRGLGQREGLNVPSLLCRWRDHMRRRGGGFRELREAPG